MNTVKVPYIQYRYIILYIHAQLFEHIEQ